MRTAAWIVLLIITAGVATYLTRRVGASEPAPSPYENVGSIRELMQGIVDPASDVIFESVATISDASGVTERQPRTDEEWATVEHNALMMAEAANLLKMPGRIVARPGAVEAPANEAVPELTPAQIQQKIDADRNAWNQHATVLMQQALRALDAARKRDVAGLYEVGGDLDEACETCHLVYWYPNAPKPPAQ